MTESDELLELLTGLLAISEISGEAARKRFAATDLAATAEEMVQAYRPSLEESGIKLTGAFETAFIMGEKRLLQRAVANLLDNLRFHTPAGTKAHISVGKSGDAVHLRLFDTGPGVPEEDRYRIFEPMIRLDRSRSPPGHSLGLGMVAAVVGAHKGRVEILPSSPGLTFDIRFPAAA